MKKSNYSCLIGIILAIVFFWFTSGSLPMDAVNAETPVEVSMSNEALSIVELINDERSSSGLNAVTIEPELQTAAEELLSGYVNGKKISEISVSQKKGSVQVAQKNATVSGIVNSWMKSASEYLLSCNRVYVAACTQNDIIYAVIVLE